MKDEARYLKLLKKTSANIKKYRLKSGLTQEEFAEKIDISCRYYQKLESGKYSPSLFTLYKISKNLRVDVNLLLK